MKKVLLFSILLVFTTLCAFAYETIIIKYPDGEKWEKAYYKKLGNEAILQYTPAGQTTNNWTRSIVIHSYNNSPYAMNVFVDNTMQRMVKINPTSRYITLKLTDNDAMLTRCTENYKNVQGQCEFMRITHAHGGTVTIHYMNKNKQDFKENYTVWYEIIKRTKFYNSYYRDERVLDKAEYFEL